MTSNFWRNINYARILKNIIIIMLAIIIIFIGLLMWARQPISSAKHQATSLAKEKVGITKVNHFYMSDLNRTYYTVKGTNQKHQQLYAVIEKKTGHIVVVQAKDGINDSKAQSIANQRNQIKKLISVSPTIFNNKVAWSVSYFNDKNELNYAIIDFRTGKIVRFIANV